MFALMKQSEKKTPSENPRENLSLFFFFFLVSAEYQLMHMCFC